MGTPSIRWECITATDDLRSLEPQWYDLWRRCPDATPFQSPDWLIPWLKHFRQEPFFILALCMGGSLIGLAILYLDAKDGIHFAGEGVSDYLDVLADPAFPETADAIISILMSRTENWTGCRFSGLRNSSPFLKACRRYSDTRFVRVEQQDAICPYVPLPGASDELLGKLSEMQSHNILRTKRLLERAGVTVIEVANKDSLAEQLDAFFMLHASRWSSRNLPGVLEGDTIQAFHRDAAYRLIQDDSLRLYGLRHNGSIMASLYCLFAGKTAYYYLGGFATSLKRLSPGTLLIARAMEDAVAEGLSEFDFLRGAETYKYAWGAVDRRTYTVMFSRRAAWP